MAQQEVAYGFVGAEHLFSSRPQTVEGGTARLFNMIAQSAQFYSTQVNNIMADMVFRTTLRLERFEQPGGGTLQPLDDYGNPLPVQPPPPYDVGYPIVGGGTAFGDNRVSRALMTFEEANRHTLDAQRRDADWLKRQIIARSLTKASYTYERRGEPAVTVHGFANGDTTTYLGASGTLATDDHYLSQAAAIADGANPFPTIYRELTEHPGNTGQVVVYVASNLVTTISGMAGFVQVADSDLELGSGQTRLRGSIDKGLGDEVIGKKDKCWIIEWRALPDNYMIAKTRGVSPIAMREYPAATLQGFFPENHSPDGNLQVHRFLRYCGFGVRNRVGGLAYFVGNASYTTPAAYTAPLAI